MCRQLTFFVCFVSVLIAAPVFGDAILAPGDFIIAIDADSASGGPAGERAPNAIDRDITTKYLNSGKENSGFIVTPSFGPSIVTSFELTTANDVEARDPATWVLYGTNDAILSTDNSAGNSESWTLIDSGSVSLPSARRTLGPMVTVNSTATYTSYKMLFPTVKDTGATTQMQIAEVQFYGEADLDTPRNPNPPNGAEKVDVDADLSWIPGESAASHEVYFGEFEPPTYRTTLGATATTWDPGALDYLTDYYWQIVATDGVTDWPGPVWQFMTAPDPAMVVDVNLVGWWKFDGDYLDSSGYQHHGTLLGNGEWVDGPPGYGQAIELDGDDYVNMDGYKGVLGRRPFSIAAWVKTTAIGDRTIVSWGTNTNGQKVDFRLQNGLVRIEHGNGNRVTNSTVNDGEWHHVAVAVIENASISYPDVTLYIDGQDDTATGTDNDMFGTVADTDVSIGRRSLNNDRFFIGTIDEVRIYDRALNTSEIEQLAMHYEATGPIPADEAVVKAKRSGANLCMILEYEPGKDAVSHTGYFSENYDDVLDRVAGANLGEPPYLEYEMNDYYVGYDDPANIPAFARVSLVRGRTYYWAVDESDGVTTYQGTVWSFTVMPEEARDPDPFDGAKYVIADQGATLSWNMGDVDTSGNSVRYEVYYGTDEAAVETSTTPDVIVSDPTSTYTTEPLLKDTVYYWRVDTKLALSGPPFTFQKRVKGTVWSFTTFPDIAITDPNLVVWWRFDEGQGSTAIDWSGHGNNGTLIGDPQWVAGKIGSAAIDLDGTDDLIDLDRGTIATDAYSIAFWHYPRNLPYSSGYRALMHTDAWTAGSMHLHLRVNTSLVNIGWNGGQNATASAASALVSGEWYHIAMSADRLVAPAESKIYINGVLEGSGTGDASALILGPLNFGAWTENSRYVDGRYDDIRIYDYALSEADIASIMDPAKAWNPSPADREAEVPLGTKLTWSPGIDEDTGSEYTKHDVYFGASYDAVDSATTPEATLTGDVNEHPVVLAYETDYYWRIDGVNAGGGAYKGAVWTFKTMDNPALARDPDPNDGATGVARNAVLSWKPGDYAPPTSGHYVYFGADDPANMALVASQPQSPNNYSPGALDLGTTYYWAVDEANAAAPGGVDAGRIWFFTTIDHLVVDDMESYENQSPGWIFDTWKDGFGDFDCIGGNGTGSGLAMSASIYLGGYQSMQYAYDNDGTVTLPCPPSPQETRAYYSKIEVAVADLPSGIDSDWMAAGAKALVLQFYGMTGNAIEPMWVELTDSAGGNATVTYGDYADENPADINGTSWHEWNIDLQDFANGGVSLANVSSIAIGFGSPIATTPGGSGLVYFDDIRLYAPRCILGRREADFALVDYAPEGDPNGDCVIDYKELDVMSRDWLEFDYNVDPVEPNAAGLVAWYEFENDANDSSPNGLDGTENGMPFYAAGQVGQAISLDGFDDYIDCGTNSAFNLTDVTVACWIKVTTFDKSWQAIVTKGDNSWRIHRWGGGNGIDWAHTGLTPLDIGGSTNVNDGAWHHIAGTYDGTNRVLYVDGQVDASDTPTGTVSTTSTHPVLIGENAQATGRFWSGMIDDVRIYDYALTFNEIVSIRGLGTLYVPVTSPANISDDEPVTEKKVNFKDYALVGEKWLDEDLFP